MKITEATADGEATGVELIPVSDGGSPKSLAVSKIKEFVIDQIEAISAGSSVTGANSVFILQGGVLKPVDIDLISQYAIDAIWAETAETAPDGADIMPLLDGSTEKTVTLALLAEYVRSVIESTILDITDLDAVSITDTDVYMVCTAGGTAKKFTHANLVAAVYAGFDTYLLALNAASSANLTDIIYVTQGGTEKQITIQKLSDLIGGGLTGSGTDGFLAKWSGSSSMTAGPSIATGFTTGSNAEIPTSKAVVDYLDDNIVNESSSLEAEVIADGDSLLMFDVSALAQLKCSFTEVWTWIETNLASFQIDDLAAGTTGGTDLDATTAIHGLMSDADKTKIDGIEALADVTDATNVNTAGAVMNTDATTAGMSFVVDEDAMGSDLDTKVPTQQSVKAYVDAESAGALSDAEDYVDARIPQAVNGTLATGANADFAPTALVYAKTCSDSDGNDVIDLHDGTVIGQILTVYLTAKAGSDNAVLTPVSAFSYTTVTLDATDEIATLQWQGATVGWAILYTNGTVA